MQFKKSLKINEILHITLAREEIYFFLLVLYFNILPLILHIEKKSSFVPLHRKNIFLFWYVTAQKEQQTTKWIHKSKR